MIVPSDRAKAFVVDTLQAHLVAKTNTLSWERLAEYLIEGTLPLLEDTGEPLVSERQEALDEEFVTTLRTQRQAAVELVEAGRDAAASAAEQTEICRVSVTSGPSDYDVWRDALQLATWRTALKTDGDADIAAVEEAAHVYAGLLREGFDPDDRHVPNEYTPRCPTCLSPNPAQHPATGFEGEVQPCADPWHHPAQPEDQ